MMKIKSLILAMAACAGMFSACSNDDVVSEIIDNGQDSGKNAYASFSFVMPNSGPSTRAGGQNGDGSEVGSKDENDVSDAYILLFKADKTLAQVETLTRGQLTPKNEGNITIYTTKSDIAVAIGSYNVQVVINPTADFKAVYGKNTDGSAKGGDYTAFSTSVETVAQTKGEYCTNGRFMMTNADEVTTTVVTKDNVEGHAKEVTVNVERMAAKVTFTPTKEGNKYDIYDVNSPSTVIGSVAFDAYKVINTRNSAYNLRRVSEGEDATKVTIGGKETPATGIATNYVVENEWASKASWNLDKFKTIYSRKYTDYVAFRKLSAGVGSQTLAYCLENTMVKGQQIDGYSTTVILRAKTTLKNAYVNGLPEDHTGETYTGSLYKYAGQFFVSRLAIVKLENPSWDGTSKVGLTANTLGVLDYLNNLAEGTEINQELINTYLMGITANVLYDDYGAEYFANGNCYYKVILRHSNNNDPEKMGIMEFAIVRNNIYKLSINSVKFMGSCTSGTPGPKDPTKPGTGEPDVDPTNPNPEIPGEVVEPESPSEPVIPIIPTDPENPDEKDEVTYLNVTIQVLDWTIRNNGVDL